MRRHCELVPVMPQHVDYVAAFMRPRDVAEVWASHHAAPAEALQRGVSSAIVAWTGLVNGEPVCIFGASPNSLLTGDGSPWMLATPTLQVVERPFLRVSRAAVEAMQDIFPRLVNYVDNRNVCAQRWLAWLGFTLEPPAPYGAEQLLFRRFWRER
jgi:hypothetical protein